MPSSTTKLHAVRRTDVSPEIADAIRRRLEYARAAQLLTSYDGSFFYEGGELLAFLSPEVMHPADRGVLFDFERRAAEVLVDRAMANRLASSPPGSR